VNGSALLDELLAVEIEKRLGVGNAAVDPAALRILLHSLRGSVAMAGYADLALVIGQLDQRYRQQEPDVEQVTVDFCATWRLACAQDCRLWKLGGQSRLRSSCRV
jgi:hypothetical protein